MYNRYIPEHVNCTPVEPPEMKKRAEPVQNPRPKPSRSDSLSYLQRVLGQGRWDRWIPEKVEQAGGGLLGVWKELNLDRGDLLLLLIVLLLMTQEDEGDLLLALGAVMLLDGEKKKQEDE